MAKLRFTYTNCVHLSHEKSDTFAERYHEVKGKKNYSFYIYTLFLCQYIYIYIYIYVTKS